PERSVLRALSVFAGGWTLEAAEAVCAAGGAGGRAAAGPAADVLDRLARLIDKSLVLAEELAGAARYRLVEAVRGDAPERLVASGEGSRVQGRQAAYYVQLAERAGPNTGEQHPRRWFERMQREHANLRAALRWYVHATDAEQGLRLAVALEPFWLARGHL